MEPDPGALDQIARAICARKHYQLDRRIAGGSFKETYLVHANGERLALKVLKPGSDPQRLLREIDALRRCVHPAINQLLLAEEWDTASGPVAFLVEPFLSGGTLTARLQARPNPALSVVQRWAVALANAIAHLESHGLVHRDVKPDNIMFAAPSSDDAMLVDFGIARDLHDVSLTPTAASMGPGTPLFTSPEQLNNQKALIDWRCDQFSLGVLLGYCILGAHPYDQGNDQPPMIVERVGRREGPSARHLAGMEQKGLPALSKLVMPWPIERFREPQGLLQMLSALGG